MRKYDMSLVTYWCIYQYVEVLSLNFEHYVSFVMIFSNQESENVLTNKDFFPLSFEQS